MKNRTRESCTSGSVRDEDGNILIYSARPRCTPRRRDRPASETLNTSGHYRNAVIFDCLAAASPIAIKPQ